MSTSSIKGGLSSFFSLLRVKDPVKREILESTMLIDRMLRTLESSRRSLESLADEYKRRAKVPGQDGEISRIIEEEVNNIFAYLSLITKTLHDLTRVKYRLETLAYIEEPLKVIPEILAELRSIEPELEKINPQLLTHIKMLEQRVTSILAVTSPVSIGNFSTANTYSQQQHAEIKEVKFTHTSVPKDQSTSQSVSMPVSTVKATKGSNVERQKSRSPVAQNTATSTKQLLKEPTVNLHKSESVSLPLHIIEQWILNELKITAGILDLGIFEKKYGISRERILEALSSLEAKGLIKIRRK